MSGGVYFLNCILCIDKCDFFVWRMLVIWIGRGYLWCWGVVIGCSVLIIGRF